MDSNSSKILENVTENATEGGVAASQPIKPVDYIQPAIFAPIPLVGFPKITPKFLDNLAQVQSRHRKDRDRMIFGVNKEALDGVDADKNDAAK